MAGAAHLVYRPLQARTAGFTGSSPSPANDPSKGPTPFDVLPGMGQLTGIVAGGVHPEAVPVPHAVPVETPTASIRSRLGGLIPTTPPPPAPRGVALRPAPGLSGTQPLAVAPGGSSPFAPSPAPRSVPLPAWRTRVNGMVSRVRERLT